MKSSDYGLWIQSVCQHQNISGQHLLPLRQVSVNIGGLIQVQFRERHCLGNQFYKSHFKKNTLVVSWLLALEHSSLFQKLKSHIRTTLLICACTQNINIYIYIKNLLQFSRGLTKVFYQLGQKPSLKAKGSYRFIPQDKWIVYNQSFILSEG